MLTHSRMSNVDYYSVLEINKDATQDDIKRAYRQLAMKWHPDKHVSDSEQDKKKAEDKFKALSEAYEILGNHETRKIYDIDRLHNINKTHKRKFQTSSDIFENFCNSFGNSNGEFNFNLGGGRKMHMSMRDFDFISDLDFDPDFDSDCDIQIPKPKDPPTFHDVFVSLSELYHGCVKKLNLTRSIHFDDVVKQQSETITIEVLPGWKEGTKITFKNKGNKYPNKIPGDTVFVIKQKRHDYFKRDGDDLIFVDTVHVNNNIYSPTNPNMYVRYITHIDEQLKIEVSKDLLKNPNYEHVVPNKGMPIRKNGKQCGYGKLIIKFIRK